MMDTERFTIKIAEINVGIEACGRSMRSFCKDYISEGEPAFSVYAGDIDLAEERAQMFAYTGRKDAPQTELERLYIFRQIAEKMPDYGVFLMHANAICVDGSAYLLTGPSGAGKTTHARLWKQEFGDRMRVINDDKPLIRMDDHTITACGSPWSGKERWHNNISAPLKALIRVRQAEENRISTMSRADAWEHVMSQTYRSNDPNTMKKTLAFVDGLIGRIPVYALDCNTQRDAVMTAYEAVSR